MNLHANIPLWLPSSFCTKVWQRSMFFTQHSNVSKFTFSSFFVTEEDASRCTRSKVVRRKKKKRNQVFGRLLIFLIALFSQLLQEKSSESDTRHRKETIQLIMLSWKDSVAFCTHFHLHDFDAVSCNFSPWWKHAGHGVPSASSSTHAWIDFS